MSEFEQIDISPEMSKEDLARATHLNFQRIRDRNNNVVKYGFAAVGADAGNLTVTDSSWQHLPTTALKCTNTGTDTRATRMVNGSLYSGSFSNGAWTCDKAGWYTVSALIVMNTLDDGKKMITAVDVNNGGATTTTCKLLGRGTSGAGVTAGFGGTAMVYLDHGDVLRLLMFHTSSTKTIYTSPHYLNFSAFWVHK